MSAYDQFLNDTAGRKTGTPSTPPAILSVTEKVVTPEKPATSAYAQFQQETSGGGATPKTAVSPTVKTEPAIGIVKNVERKVMSFDAGFTESVGQLMRSFQWMGDRLVGDYVTQKDSQKRLTEDLATNKVQVDQIVALIRKQRAEGKDPSHLEEVLKNMKINPADYPMTADTTTGIFYKAQDKTKEWADILRKSAGITPENRTFAEKVFEGAGSSATYFIPALGTAKYAGALARVSPTMAMIFGGSASAGLESMAEAGQVYDEVKKTGTAQDAMVASNKTFLANAILLGLTERLGVFNPEVKGVLKKALISMPTEGFQEATQQLIQNMNTGNNPWDGVLESGVIGGIIGGVMGAGVDLTTSRPVQLGKDIGAGEPPAGAQAPEAPTEPALELQKRLEGGLPTEPAQVPAEAPIVPPTPTEVPSAPIPTPETPQVENLVAKIQQSEPLTTLQDKVQSSDSLDAFTKNISSNLTSIIPQGTDITTFLHTNGFASLEEFYKTVKNDPTLNTPSTATGSEIALKIKKIGSDQGGISTWLQDEIAKEDYKKETITIDELLKNDADLKEYIDGAKGKIRKFKGEAFAMEPIVSSTGNVHDGYNRIAQAIKDGKTSITILKGVAPRTPEVIKEEKVSKDELAKLHEDLRNEYRKIGTLKDEPDFLKADETLSYMAIEMDLAKAGERLFTPDGVVGIPSTFPQWIEEENRSKALFSKVMSTLEISKLEYPSRSTSDRQRKLYNDILDQLDARLGVDTEIIRNKILQSYERRNKKEVAKKSKRGTDGGAIRGTGKLKGATFEEVATPQSIAEKMAKESAPMNEIAGAIYKGGFGLTQKEAGKIARESITVKVKQASIDKFREDIVRTTPSSPEEASQIYWDAIIVPEISKGNTAVIGADDMKDFFGKDYNDTNHPIYSRGAYLMYERALKEARDGTVAFTGGGAGSGKTEVLVKQVVGKVEDSTPAILYDSNMANYDGVVKQINLAKDNGRDIVIFGILPNLDKAREFTIIREAEVGRGISGKTFARGHAGFPRIAKQLLDNKIVDSEDVYLLDERIFRSIEEIKKDVRDGLFIEDPLALLDEVQYNEEDLKKKYEKTTTLKITDRTKTPKKDRGAIDRTLTKDRADSKGQASIGKYRDDTEVIINASALKPIQFPELIDISKEIMGNTPFIRKYTKANGMFYGRGGGEIGLNPDLFKQENLGQLQKTLAHEIGHLIDYLPDQTMTRGNLAGRLNTLRDFRKDFFAPMGASRTDKELREQMWALSKYWRPVDEATTSASHLAYRKGSDEIYADFISALFNDPRLTADMAPTAYNVFFEKLDAKPKVKEAYFGLQDLLRYGDVIAKRRSATQKMFKTTEQSARERQIQDQVEKDAKEESIWFKFKTQAVDITEAVRVKVKDAEKRGIRINDDDNPNYYLEQRNYLGGKIKAEVDEKFNGIYQELQKNDLAWEDLGELMFYERVLKGDRQDIANPLGYQPDFVRELYDVYEDVGTVKPDQAQYDKGTGDMRSTLGDEKFNILKSLAEQYRSNLKGFFKQGREEGIYNAELEQMFEDNAFYVPFKGAKYSGVTKTAFTVKQQKGTLGDIENPANTGIEKAVSIIRAMERNKVARKTMDFLQANFADEVQEAKLDKQGYPIEPREKDLGLVTYMKDGKVKGFYVDKYIAESIQKKTVADLNVGIEVLKYFNSSFYRPLFITFNLGFQSFNLIRDFKRFWKNVPNMTILKAMNLYAKSARGAKIRAFGLPENPSPADIEAHNLIIRLEKEQVLSITFNDVIKGEEIEDKQIERILREVGIREAEKTKLGKLAEKIGVDAKTPVIRELRALLDTIEKMGNMIETLPKIAGLYAMDGTMPPMEMRSYLRKYVGSPDFLAGGKFKPYANEVFLFSNAIFHGIRSDYEIATAPKSRGAYWMKTAQLELVPKMLMMMAVAGLFGDWIKEMFANVSEYDKTNYTIVPMGIDQNGKTVYIRIPSDETGRLIGGLFWKTMSAIKDPEKLAEMDTYTNILAYAGGQVPSLTPTVTTGMNAMQFLAGNNPYDFFRGRPILTDQQQQAGGTERLKPFMAYMFEQLGGGVFLKLYTNETVPRNPSLSEKIVALPVLSNIAGRFVRVSDYGQKEILRNISNEVKTEQARESLQNRRIVFDYVDNARGKSPAEANVMKHQMINEIFNGVPKTQQDRTKAKSLMTRFDTLLLRGSADARIDSLITAQSNEEKVALLKQYKKTMSVTDFEDLKKFVIQKRVVSPQAFQMFTQSVDK